MGESDVTQLCIYVDSIDVHKYMIMFIRIPVNLQINLIHFLSHTLEEFIKNEYIYVMPVGI